VQAARGKAIAGRGVIGPTAARRLIAGVAVTGLALDILTKMLAVSKLDPENPSRLLGGLITFRLIRNPGAAFSLGENATVLFALLAVAALAGVGIWIVPKVAVTSWAIATGLLLAGIAGNLVDRLFRAPGVFRGHVVDFIQLPYFGAIFNVADMCLTFAAATILVVSLFSRTNMTGATIMPDEGKAAATTADTASTETPDT
jgi:signal peptidase II